MANYFRRGTTKVLFDTAAPASLSAPTAAEIAAADDLSASIAAMDGFTYESQPLTVMTLSSDTDFEAPGIDTVKGGTLTLHAQKAASGVTNWTTDTVYAALSKGTTGYIYICPTGTATGSGVEVWPVTVQSASQVMNMGNETAKAQIVLIATAVPTRDAVIAA